MTELNRLSVKACVAIATMVRNEKKFTQTPSEKILWVLYCTNHRSLLHIITDLTDQGDKT